MSQSPHPIVGIPVKPFGVAKQRLHPRLGAAARSRLGRAIAARTADTVAAAGGAVAIVTADPGVHGWAEQHGLATMAEEESGGLDGAARVVVATAGELGQPWLVVHADLPLLTPADVTAVLEPLRSGRSVIAPSHDGGTSAIGGYGPLRFAYGPGSFHRHLRQLHHPAVVVRPGWAFDLDTVDDLDRLLAAPGGAWFAELVTGLGAPA